MDNIIVKQGDYGYAINFTVKDSGGAPVILTAYVITLKVWLDIDSPILEEECDIISAPSGTCRYIVADGDFDDVGEYSYELELTTASSVESTDTGNLTVKASPVTEVAP